MEKIVCLLLLAIASISDIKTRTIPIWIPTIGIILSIMINGSKLVYGEYLMGVIFGSGIFILSLFVKGFGAGDGMMVFVIALLKGIFICAECLFLALIFTVITGMVIKIVKHKKEDIELPFIPFLLVSLVFMEFGGEFI